ncbi:MAG TPA: biliverdin-producing heme oxygenase [Blastococcus sp.]|jgi:heme oxygenase|nr:biliverdin-producing heme oxygenase [Blastococcus sp.]
MAGEAGAAAGRGDVLHDLRTTTSREHAAVEAALDLMAPALGRRRLADVLRLMHGFWVAAEAGLDDWADRFPDDAAALQWPRRRRARLFAADRAVLEDAAPPAVPDLAAVPGTDEALGRLYVLEGSTLGGVLIDRHLATLPELSGVRLRAFSPYGAETGAMWHAFRTATRERVAGGGQAAAVVTSACSTFAALAAWCRPGNDPAAAAG